MSRLNAYNLARSFSCALSGVIRSLWYERNLRIHMFASAYVLYFSGYFDLSKSEYAVLFAVIGLVLACELINTAIEAAVDLTAPEYSVLAKTAKDAAAGAVLTSSAASAAVGFVFFWRPEVLRLIWRDIVSTPSIWFFIIVITIFLIAWPERRQMAAESQKNNCIKEIK